MVGRRNILTADLQPQQYYYLSAMMNHQVNCDETNTSEEEISKQQTYS
jgi:hypothetical protein